jgi:ornithine--oxo-acid transaminase
LKRADRPENIIRFAPPLVISEADIDKAVQIIATALEQFDTIEAIPGAEEHH